MTDGNGGTTPSQIEEDYKTALAESIAEFGRCLGTDYDEELLERVRTLFDWTIGKAITNGVEWEEPIRSYGLRHVCKIARKVGKCAPCEGPSADELEDVYKDVIKQAKKTCGKLVEKKERSRDDGAVKIGILCEGE